MNTLPKNTWPRALRNGIAGFRSFFQSGYLKYFNGTKEDLIKINEQFMIRIPNQVLPLIDEGNGSIAAQFIPTPRELNWTSEEREDPIGDETFSPIRGLTHRYPDRVLIKPTHLCASYCRFCFRKYKVSQASETLSEPDKAKIICYLKENTQVQEVIFTGGDPFTLTQNQLNFWLDSLNPLEHIKHIRFHTRVPLLLSERIDESLIHALEASPKRVRVVVHVNHVSEFNPQALRALDALRRGGVTLLCQSVLLRGVNASLADLRSLYLRAIELGISPYYLHYPDVARGTSHFRVPLQRAIDLYDALRGTLPGYAIPQFVLDIPGGGGKVPVVSQWVWPDPTDSLKNTWFFKSPLTGKISHITYSEV